ncbi:MAG: hypothetical protein GKR93_04460 [Gammaproteobacteria bacterium]|nr:hypothetical protein [Gammaproteobacteria bacterium]
MGSFIEFNDTLQISTEQGFPVDILELGKHEKNPISIADVNGRIFTFYNKSCARLYHLDPVRVFLVENINNKWLFWGKILIQSQEIKKKLDGNGVWVEGEWQTSGTYIITDIYDPEYQKLFTVRESAPGKSYF